MRVGWRPAWTRGGGLLTVAVAVTLTVALAGCDRGSAPPTPAARPAPGALPTDDLRGATTDQLIDLARIRSREGRLDVSESAIEAAIVQSPEDVRPYTTMVEILLSAGRAGDAVTWSERMVATHAESGQAHLVRATALIRAGNFAGAEAAAERSRDLRTWTPSSWQRLGEAWYAASRVPEAIAAFEQALALDAQNRAALLALGQARYFAGDPAGAHEVLAEAARLAQEDGDALVATALALWRLDDVEAAETALNEALARFAAAGVDPRQSVERFNHWPDSGAALQRLSILATR